MKTHIKKKVEVAKKAPKRKVTLHDVSGMVCAEGEQCFWSQNGQVLATMVDLKHALAEMDTETFAHHVTKDKNDFADWVEFVLIDKKCADGLRKAKTLASTLACVEKRLGV